MEHANYRLLKILNFPAWTFQSNKPVKNTLSQRICALGTVILLFLAGVGMLPPAPAMAAEPAPIDARLEQLLIGSEVKEASIRGLRIGMSYEQAENLLARDWNFTGGTGKNIPKEFGPTPQDINRYTETEQRDGGRFKFDTMTGTVGQIQFIENYTVSIDADKAFAWLKERFGEPAKFKTSESNFVGFWSADGSNLVVFAGNQVTGRRSSKIFKSSLVITMWSPDYEKYLAAAEKRCGDLKQKPANQLTDAELQEILKGCKTP